MSHPTPRRTALKGLLIRGFDGLRRGVLPMAVLVYTLRENGTLALLAGVGIAAVILIASTAMSFLTWTRLTYTVGDEDIRVDSGLLSRTARSVPYDRIQDVSLEQKLVPRLFGLVAVKFETGAGAGEDLSLHYLTEDEGERLRELVRDRRDGAADGRIDGEAPVPAAAITLFAMSPRRVLTYGLFNFSLVVMAAFGGAVQQFDFLLPFDPFDFGAWEHVLAGPGTWLAGLGLFAQAVGAAIALLSLLVVGVVTGVIRTALREWNFRLERTPRGLRRRRGLLTRTDVMLPVYRVQAQMIGTGIVRRWFGWKHMSLVSLAQDEGSGNHAVAPFARQDELQRIIAVTGFTPPAGALDWHRPVAAFRVHRALGRMAGWAAIAGAALVVQRLVAPDGLAGDPRWALVPLLWGMISAFRAWFLPRFAALALDPRQVQRQSGWLASAIMTASREKLHSVELVQGPLARRSGYATLRLGLAGGELTMGGLALPVARALAGELLGSMTRADFSRLNQARNSAQFGFSANLRAT